MNFVPAGQVPSGANDKLLDPRKCHVPRINGVIFTWSDKSASTRFILNAGAYGPDSSVYEIIASAGGVSSRSLFTSGMLFWVAKKHSVVIGERLNRRRGCRRRQFCAVCFRCTGAPPNERDYSNQCNRTRNPSDGSPYTMCVLFRNTWTRCACSSIFSDCFGLHFALHKIPLPVDTAIIDGAGQYYKINN